MVRAVAEPLPDAYTRFLATGGLPGNPLPSVLQRRAFLKEALRDPAFRAKAWPHFACFVDASNVARWDPPAIHEVNTPKAHLWRLVRCEAALRKRGYIAIMVSDGNLFHLMDDPYGFQERYTRYPHSVAKGYQADRIVLRALRSLPEAACVTRDRYDKPDELRDFADVLADRTRFFAFRFDAEDSIDFFREGVPMPSAVRRLAERWPARAE